MRIMRNLTISSAVSLFILFTVQCSFAGQYAVSLEKDKIVVGEKIAVSFIFLESGSAEIASFPDEIHCELRAGEGKFTVLANKIPRQEKQKKVENYPGVRQYYRLTMPLELQGQVIMSFLEIDTPRIVLDVVAPARDNIGTSDKATPSLDSIFTLYQPYLKNAGAYEPVYFLVGTELEKSKFQISFKYRFFDPDSPFASSNPWVDGVHFGYTQISFWDLESDSAPFDDTSYKPEVFWLSKNWLGSEHGLLQGVFVQGGFQHESNGKAGYMSRSTNHLYIKPILVFYDEDSKLGLQVSPKFWSYIGNDDSTNADLPAYRGYFDLEMKFGLAESFVAGTHFRWADEGASFQFDISYPLHKIFGDALDVYFYAQYSNVLAESLLDYEDRTQAFRLGLAFIR